MKTIDATVWLQYALAALALVALVVLNVWGKPDDALSTVLVSVISATVWGGLQRQSGIKKGAEAP